MSWTFLVLQQQQNLRRRFGTSKMHLSLRWFRLVFVRRRWFCCCWLVVYCSSHCGSLYLFMFCCMLLYVPSSFAIILMGKRELVALLSLSTRCPVMVVWFFLAVPWVCLQFVIVVFPDHTHLLFFREIERGLCWQKSAAWSNKIKTLFLFFF